MDHANVNVNLMVENVIKIKSEITINIGVSAKSQKNVICAKKIIFGILLHVVVKMVNIEQVLLTSQLLGEMTLWRKQKLLLQKVIQKLSIFY